MPPRERTDFEARERIRKWLQRYMDERGWSRLRLGKELGVGQPTVQRIMTGERGVGLDLLIAVQEKLHVSADDVLAGRLETARTTSATADSGGGSGEAAKPVGPAAEEASPPARRSRGKHDPAVGARIDALREERGMPPKALFEEMGLEKGEYSRKVRGLTMVFADEAAAAARILRAPPGWPYVTVEQGLLLAALGSRVTEVLQALPEILDVLARNRSTASPA